MRDVALLERKRRRLVHLDCPAAMRAELRRRKVGVKFRSKSQAIAVIRALNLGWFDHHDAALGVDLARALGDRSGRRRLRREDLAGDRTGLGGARLTSWNRVLTEILPASHLWSEVPARLQELHDEVQRGTDAHVPPLLVPEGVFDIEDVQRAYEDCDGVREAMFAEVLARATGGRLRGGARPRVFEYDESVPF